MEDIEYEIESILKPLKSAQRGRSVEIMKMRLKHLIELVENEQVQKCSCHFLQDKFENVLNNQSVVKAPRVSQTIDWEEL